MQLIIKTLCDCNGNLKIGLKARLFEVLTDIMRQLKSPIETIQPIVESSGRFSSRLLVEYPKNRLGIKRHTEYQVNINKILILI